MTALGSNPGNLGASHGVSFNEKNTMKKVCMLDCFWKKSNDPWHVCVCACACALQSRWATWQVVSLGVQRARGFEVGRRRKSSEKRKRRNSRLCTWCADRSFSPTVRLSLYIHCMCSASEMSGAPSCSICHWHLFLLEIFRTWTSRGCSPLLPVEGGAGQFSGPRPSTLWLPCPSRLRTGWLLARHPGCWELICTQHFLETHIQFSWPPELGGLGGTDLVHAEQRVARAHTRGGGGP